MNYFKDLVKNYIGPALVAAVLIYGYWSYQTVSLQKQIIQQQTEVLNQLSQVLSGQCQAMLDAQKGQEDAQ